MSDEMDLDDVDTSTSSEEDDLEDFNSQLRDAGEDTVKLKELLNMCRQEGELINLRLVRQKLAEISPQHIDFWLNWIDDEQPIAASDQEKHAVLDLCHRALEDVNCVAVHCRLLASSAHLDSENRMKLFQRAIRECGHDLANGCRIWSQYRHFLLSLWRSAQDTMKSEIRQFLLLAFETQLSIPMSDNSTTMEELNELAEELNIEVNRFQELYAESVIDANQRAYFEHNVISCSGSTWKRRQAYHDYIKYEMDKGKPASVSSCCRRAVVEHPRDEEFWRILLKNQAYCSDGHKEAMNGIGATCIKWNPEKVELWLEYARCLEAIQDDAANIKAVFNRALNSNFPSGREFREIYIGYIDYLRRRLVTDNNEEPTEAKLTDFRDIFQVAINQLYSFFGVNGDTDCVLERYWAFAEAKYFKDMEQARTVWRDHIFAIGHSEEFEFWRLYLEFESMYGDEKHYRKGLIRAIKCVKDEPEKICRMAVDFEHRCGSLNSLSNVLTITRERLIKHKETMSEVENRKRKATTKKLLEPNTKVTKTAENSLSTTRFDKDGFPIPFPTSKHGKDISKKEGEDLPKKEGKDSSKKVGEDIPKKEGKNSPKKEVAIEPFMKEGKTSAKRELKPSHTVFISNLAYGCDEACVRQVFQDKAGKICQFDLAKGTNGVSRGFGHIEFESADSVKLALDLDHFEIEGRPVFVSEYISKNMLGKQITRKKQFKYKTALEKSKLFIKNLNPLVSQDKLKELFESFGSLKDIRIVKYRNGHSKGIAYVEFETEEAASTALITLDGTMIEGRPISVAVSDPPVRQTQSSVSRQANDRKLTLQTTEQQQQQQVNNLLPRSLQQSKSRLSNDDFRKMVLRD